MAAIIETATKSVDAVEIDDFEDVDGFVSGDPQVGLAPTQLSPKFFNATTAEFGKAIRGIHSALNPPDLDPDNWGQLRDSINNRFISNYPKSEIIPATWICEWRSQWHENIAAYPWKRVERTDRKENVADDATYNLSPFVPPNDSQFIVKYTCVIVSTSSITSRSNVEIIASGRRPGAGNVVVQSSTTVIDDSPGLTIAVTVVGVTTNVALHIDIPITGENYNIFVTGTLTVVTMDT